MAQQPPWTGGATADATGRAVVTFQPRANQVNKVTQVAAEMAGAVAATGAIRRNGSLVSPFVPTGDAAGGDPPIWLWPGDLLTVEWTGAPVGGVGKVTIFFDIGA